MIIKRKLYSLAGTRMLAGFNKKILRRPAMAAKRSAVKTQNKVLGAAAKGLNKIEGVKTAVNQAAINPGGAVNTGIETLARNPIATTGQVASVALPIANPSLAVVPVGTPSIAVEAALKRKIPAYSRVTNKIADRYHGATKTRRTVEGVTNGAVNYLKSVTL